MTEQQVSRTSSRFFLHYESFADALNPLAGPPQQTLLVTCYALLCHCIYGKLAAWYRSMCTGRQGRKEIYNWDAAALYGSRKEEIPPSPWQNVLNWQSKLVFLKRPYELWKRFEWVIMITEFWILSWNLPWQTERHNEKPMECLKCLLSISEAPCFKLDPETGCSDNSFCVFLRSSRQTVRLG